MTSLSLGAGAGTGALGFCAGARHAMRVWSTMASMSLQAQLGHPLGSVGFLLGKLVRIFFFFAFVAAIFTHTGQIAGYGLAETALFFLTFNLVDITSQVFFRGIYAARRAVEDGDFDFYLIQPCPPLLRMACYTVDYLDLLTLLPVLVLTGIVFSHLGPLPPGRLALYLALTANGILIALSIHIFVAALAVRTQELENAIWIYRDLMFMGKFPVDIYDPPMRWALTWVIPIAVMVSFPARALLGRLEAAGVLHAFCLSGSLFAASLWFWRIALRHYTSTSS